MFLIKGLGGSGNINGMLFLRGSQRDYDRWANVTRDKSWMFESVLPHFKNIEKYTALNVDCKLNL